MRGGARNHPVPTRPLLVACGLALSLAGCAATPPSRLYTLTPTTEPGPASGSWKATDLTIGLGPVILPKYLDRPEIVERTSAFELRTAEFDRWAEPLEALVPRIVAENLSRSLGTDRVLILPQRRIPEPDFQVELEVLRFDVTTSGQVILEGLWEVYVGREEVPRAVRKSSVGEQVSGPGFPGIAEAMSRALGALSGEIAEAIRNQPGPLR